VKNPLENLDRIDQRKFPLDKSYTFPNSAGKGVNVYIVDTGVDTKHEQFENRAKIGGAFCFGCTTDGDDNGHGTHVAGIVAGKTVGVARKANIISVKVFNGSGSGSFSDVIAGLAFVLTDHLANQNKKSIVNLSLGGGSNQATNQAVAALVQNGIHVVVAAGNDGGDACLTSPASEASAVTVAALENTADILTDFSNFGNCVDIIAPGRNIKSASANTPDQLTVFSGTSQATPHVAGTIALIIANSGNLSPTAMTNKLIKLSSKNVVDESTLRGTPNNVVRVPAQKKNIVIR